MWNYLCDRKTLGFIFRSQYSVDYYVIDFYCPELKLAIELDGIVHDLPDQKEYDSYRQEYLKKFGITFFRITNDELMGNANITFKKIKDQIKTREDTT